MTNNASTVTPVLITRAVWDAIHRDFKGRMDQRPYVLRNNPADGATVMQFVAIVDDCAIRVTR